jgi:hypothetical protein
MLPKNEEIKALFTLIDDPDEEVFSTISNRLLDYGTPIIPDLENLWENTLEETTLERIEKMIYRLRLKDIHQQLRDWAALPKPSLFEGALILVKYQFPELALDPLRRLVSAYGFHPDLYNEKSFEEGRPFPSARYT